MLIPTLKLKWFYSFCLMRLKNEWNKLCTKWNFIKKIKRKAVKKEILSTSIKISNINKK